jgi:RNA polymerase sigma factor (TIGR02999 family)
MPDPREDDTEVTRLLNAARQGDPRADDDLMTAIHGQLRRIAAAKMAGEQHGQTLQPTALVHEAWLRLGDHTFENRAHFFGAAAEAMRRILVDRARRKKCAKHGGGHDDLAIDGMEIAAPVDADELLAVHDALDQLALYDSRKAQVVKLRYFAGLSFEESAVLLGISVPTAKRDWSYARAWLHHTITTG